MTEKTGRKRRRASVAAAAFMACSSCSCGHCGFHYAPGVSAFTLPQVRHVQPPTSFATYRRGLASTAAAASAINGGPSHLLSNSVGINAVSTSTIYRNRVLSRNHHSRYLSLSASTEDTATASITSYSDDTIDTFNAELEAISSRSAPTSPSVKSASQAESMLRDAIVRYRHECSSSADTNDAGQGPTTTVGAVRPDRRSFELVIQAYLNLGRSRFDDSHSVLQQFSNGSDGSGSSDDGGDNGAMCSADKVAALHGMMEQLWNDEGRPEELAPTVETFNAVLSACAACAGPRSTPNLRRGRRSRGRSRQDGAEEHDGINYAAKAEDVLQRMQDLATEFYGDDDDCDDGTTSTTSQNVATSAASCPLSPDAVSFSLLAAAWARQQPMGPKGTSWSGYERHSFEHEDTYNKRSVRVDGKCAAKAEERLRILEAMFVEDSDTEPDVLNDIELPYLLAEAYDDCLAAWARSGVDGAPIKAEDILRRWEALADDLDEWTVDVRIWNEERKDDDDDVLDTSVVHKEDLSPLSIIPTAEAYSSVILAHALSKSNIGPRKASDWLERTLELYEAGKWGNNRPDLIAFNGCITAWSSCNDDGAVEKAEELLIRLESLRTESSDGRYNYLSADSVSYNAALGGWCKRIQNAKDSERQTEAILRAKNLFDRMEAYCISGENASVCPNSRTYASLIYAWTRSGLGEEAADSANDLLRRMEERYRHGARDCRPTLQLYSANINAYAKTGQAGGAKKAMDLLQRLNDLSSQGGRWNELTPDIVIYCAVLDAIARTRMEDGAACSLLILRDVEDSYAATGDDLCRPNVRFYTAVLFVLANCRKEGNVQEAQEILKKMEQNYEETRDPDSLPNSFTYNYAINAAANTLGPLEVKSESFKVALKAFQSLRKSTIDSPNSFTYAFFLKACNSLLPLGDMRYNVIRRTTNECIKDGMLNDVVLNWLRRGVPAELGREILQFPDKAYQTVRARDLPSEWTCNARRNRR